MGANAVMIGQVTFHYRLADQDTERFHRTLADGWAYARHYTSEDERRAALPGWIHFYNHHRIHSAIGGTPTSRLNNLPGHHT
ncbi:MAG: integrase family protein [Marmoricola sp.]|nr:integrase family protein [Marmoricola sp.]